MVALRSLSSLLSQKFHSEYSIWLMNRKNKTKNLKLTNKVFAIKRLKIQLLWMEKQFLRRRFLMKINCFLNLNKTLLIWSIKSILKKLKFNLRNKFLKPNLKMLKKQKKTFKKSFKKFQFQMVLQNQSEFLKSVEAILLIGLSILNSEILRCRHLSKYLNLLINLQSKFPRLLQNKRSKKKKWY